MVKHGIAPYRKDIILSLHRQINWVGEERVGEKGREQPDFSVTPLKFFHYSLLKVTFMYRLQVKDTGMWVYTCMYGHLLYVLSMNTFSH